ncbi:prepilin-type N-terminal cleavage/methylation domain-containing protein [Chromobacterium alkanivorans]|nr:prepilin-type N-terminal cleavage/methylation domain-containing protein [Chromobacterium alkanivorans]KMN82277.1 hypothetical protein VK98_09250 [Chromobacterium sp. LK11]MCS3805269.1 prepilin-type N-terminal cleavage/methylation domain-containing protein [Chromobacterium alkanivorans]MCS3874417.1 prepilin-type N-terminal cleavage/methylation domain-containing protein [Chromobacterium alkanivorans]
MVNAFRRQRGLSLMELCATLALIGLLALLSVPLAQGWSDAHKLTLARSQLARAYAQTQAAALSNPQAAAPDQAAAVLMSSAEGQLCVFAGAPASGTQGERCQGAALWRAAAPRPVSLGTSCLQTPAAQCLALNNQGQPLAAQAAGVACGTRPAYCIRGAQQELRGDL